MTEFASQLHCGKRKKVFIQNLKPLIIRILQYIPVGRKVILKLANVTHPALFSLNIVMFYYQITRNFIVN